MNNQDIDLLNLCFEDSLFAALYGGLCNLESKWQTSSPVDMWVRALSARHKLSQSKRPDLLLQQLFVDLKPNEAVVVETILLYMLVNEDRSTESSPLKDALLQMLITRDDTWSIVYEEFRESENQNEQKEYKVCQVDYSNMTIPTKSCEQEPQQDKKLAHKFVSYALKSSNPQLCRDIHYLFSQIDYEDGHIYEDELKWLAEQTDEMERANHEPSKIVNNFHKDSCHFGQGSSMNGDVLLNNKN